MTRKTLSHVGGFEAISNQLADDYRLGELTRRAGLRTVLSEIIVETEVSDTSFKKLINHELRWLRTIRAMNPHGYRFLFLTLSLPEVAMGNWLASNSIVTLVMLGVTITLRTLIYMDTRSRQLSLAAVLLLPLRDALTLGLWGWSFVTRRVQWRDARFRIARDGSLRVIEGT